MTSNQIAYWKNVETERSDRENERLKSESQAEDRRHNTVTEAKDWFGVKENQRHNQATENQEMLKFGETKRHNLQTEALSDREIDIKKYAADMGAFGRLAPAVLSTGTKFVNSSGTGTPITGGASSTGTSTGGMLALPGNAPDVYLDAPLASGVGTKYAIDKGIEAHENNKNGNNPLKNKAAEWQSEQRGQDRATNYKQRSKSRRT